jgi:tRNA U34 5-carboxymethylaminomethyl modifying enzyme MnmG/GidA
LVTDLVIKDKRVLGVQHKTRVEWVPVGVIATGTFLGGQIHSDKGRTGGRAGEPRQLSSRKRKNWGSGWQAEDSTPHAWMAGLASAGRPLNVSHPMNDRFRSRFRPNIVRNSWYHIGYTNDSVHEAIQ